MPVFANLMERAYQLIKAGQYQNAELVLDAVVRVDPGNVMAWKAYLQVYQNRRDLDWLMERILKVRELSNSDKMELLAYYNRIVQGPSRVRQDIAEEFLIQIPSLQAEAEESEKGEKIVFELIEEFDYPARSVEPPAPKKERPVFTYPVPAYVWQGLGLVVVFYFAINLIVMKFLSGYFLMGLFLVGVVFWLKRLYDEKPAAPLNIRHTYSLEGEKKLTVIEKPAGKPQTDKQIKKPARRRRLDKS